jgi:lipoate---protein ligase
VSPAGGWRIERVEGSAGELHDRDPTGGREVWVHQPSRPAVVLGSTQPDAVVDRAAVAAAGIEVVRRRSGGGAVLVEPGGVVWVDVVIPPGDPLWDDDVARAAHWVGGVWADALRSVGVGEPEVYRGPLVTTPWSSLVCFAGVGAGEVLVLGAKVVGLAQRRTRAGARFQTAAMLRWEPDRLVALLALDPRERTAAEAEVRGRAAALPVAADRLVEAFLRALSVI